MVSLLFFLCLAILVFSVVQLIKNLKISNNEGKIVVYTVMSIFFGIFTFLFLMGVLTFIDEVGTGYTIGRKIEMYEKENASIEQSIDVTVRNYMDFEASTYGELKGKDAINLVSLFPELKSDTLVQKQIEVYLSNNAKIKELKEEEIDLSKIKWELYFGR